MSFKISAAGNPKFYFPPQTENLGDTFEAIQVLAILREMEPTTLGAASGTLDHYTPGIVDLVEALAFRESLQNLSSMTLGTAYSDLGEGACESPSTDRLVMPL